MAKVKAFKGYRYNSEKVDAVKALSPPYDVIEKALYLKLINENQYSYARIIKNHSFPPPESWYLTAKEILYQWIKDGIICEDDSLSVYIYKHRARFLDSEIERTGVISLLYNLEYKGKKIIPHERTYEIYKRDRFKLTMTTGFQLEPIFCIFPDEDGRGKKIINSMISKGSLLLKGEGVDGVHHEMWRVNERELISELAKFLEDKDVMIADGHHRFEVSKWVGEHLHKEGEDGPGRYALTFFSPFGGGDDAGVFSIHRGLKDEPFVSMARKVIEENFILQRLKDGEEKAFFENTSNEKGRFVYFSEDGKIYGCFLKRKDLDLNNPLTFLDVVLFHRFFMDILIPDEDERGKYIFYTPDPIKGIDMWKDGELKAFFLLPPFYIGHVFESAKASLKLPHKSTFFYPKIPSGIVFYKIN